MNDAFGKIVAILIGVYLMFVAPVLYMLEETDMTKNTYVLTIITEFVEEVKNTGVIDKERYDDMCDKIYSLGDGYSLKIIHSRHNYDKDGENVLFNVNNNFRGDIEEELLQNKKYYLERTDFLKITVCRNDSVICFYGGGIKNEVY